MPRTLPHTPVSGTFAATGNGTAFYPQPGMDCMLSLYGTFVGTIVLERTFDDGTTWYQASTDGAGSAASYSAPCTVVINEPSGAGGYRFRCSAYTSGTVNYRMGF